MSSLLRITSNSTSPPSNIHFCPSHAVRAQYTSHPNTQKEATSAICKVFLDRVITASSHPLKGIIEQGQKLTSQKREEEIPDYCTDPLTPGIKDNGRDMFVYSGNNNAKKLIHRAFNDLEEKRIQGSHSRIGAVFHTRSTYFAVTICESNNQHSIHVFSPNAHPKIMGGREGFCFEYSSLEKAADFFVELQPPAPNRYTMHMFMFTLKEEASHLNTTAASSSRITQSSQPFNVPSLLDTALELDRIADDILNEQCTLKQAMEHLINLHAQIPLYINNEPNLISVGALAVYHLTMLLRDNPQSLDLDYGMKAFESRSMLAIEDRLRERALYRAEADVLLQGYIDAVHARNAVLAEKYSKTMRWMSPVFKVWGDRVPELENFGAFTGEKTKENCLHYAQEVRKKMKQQWKLI